MHAGESAYVTIRIGILGGPQSLPIPFVDATLDRLIHHTMFSHLLEGHIDSLQPEKISGWAIDRADLGRRVYVDILLDGILYAKVLANLPRGDLAAAGLGDGAYGYEFTFPLVLCDGVERTLSARISDSAIALGASPMRVLFSLAEKVRPLGDPKPEFLENARAIWNRHAADEARFWWNWLTTSELYIERDRAFRLQHHRELADNIKNLIHAPEGGTVRILDVGAGPLSVIGTHWPGRSVELVPIDALAAQYAPMLKELDVIPPTPTQYADAETLSSKFPQNTFDFTHCVNALDCCANPMKAISEMVKVTRPGGCILVICRLNLAETERNFGLGQWNISLERGRPVVWSRQSYTDIMNLLGATATLERADVDRDMVILVLRSN